MRQCTAAAAPRRRTQVCVLKRGSSGVNEGAVGGSFSVLLGWELSMLTAGEHHVAGGDSRRLLSVNGSRPYGSRRLPRIPTVMPGGRPYRSSAGRIAYCRVGGWSIGRCGHRARRTCPEGVNRPSGRVDRRVHAQFS